MLNFCTNLTITARESFQAANFLTGLHDGLVAFALSVCIFSLLFILIRRWRDRLQSGKKRDKFSLLLILGMTSLLCGIGINRLAGGDELWSAISIFFFVVSGVANIIYIRQHASAGSGC